MFAYSYILFILSLCSGFYLFSTEKVIPSCFFKLLRIFCVILLLLFIVFGDIKGNHFFSKVDVLILCSVGARCTDISMLIKIFSSFYLLFVRYIFIKLNRMIQETDFGLID